MSVILPVYNQAEYLPLAIDSVLCQTFANFELIIIDDGSKQNIQRVIEKYQDSRIKFIRNKSHAGLVHALNQGLGKARGDFIARMDADDICLPVRLEKQVAYLRSKPDVGVAASWIELIDASGRTIGKETQLHTKDVYAFLTRANPFRHSSVMFRRSLVSKCGGYDPMLDGAEDYDLWLRYAKFARLAIISEILLQYRIHRRSVSYEQLAKVEWAYCRTKWHSVFSYGYPFWQLKYCGKSLLSLALPLPFKRIVYKRFFKY